MRGGDEADAGDQADAAADPRAAYSYRHPASGEWAHPRHCGPLEDAHRNYVDPAWDIFGPNARTHPDGPPGQLRPWQALIIGFGRGFEAAALLRRRAAEAPHCRMRLTGLEPQPELLQPWPPRWTELAAHEAPWWGHAAGSWPAAQCGADLVIAPCRAQDWLADQPERSLDLILLDLFSPARAAADWTPPLYPGLQRAAAAGAVLATYTCARTVRDGLAATGWQVEILAHEGFRDSLRATRAPAPPP